MMTLIRVVLALACTVAGIGLGAMLLFTSGAGTACVAVLIGCTVGALISPDV